MAAGTLNVSGFSLAKRFLGLMPRLSQAHGVSCRYVYGSIASLLRCANKEKPPNA